MYLGRPKYMVKKTLNKNLKLSRKSAKWWRQLKAKNMKKEQI
jgi:hypothetical protein